MYEGWTVPIEYDPLLAKLVGYGETREQAIDRLLRALLEYFVGGIKTNISLFRRILQGPGLPGRQTLTPAFSTACWQQAVSRDATPGIRVIAAIGRSNLRHYGAQSARSRERRWQPAQQQWHSCAAGWTAARRASLAQAIEIAARLDIDRLRHEMSDAKS